MHMLDSKYSLMLRQQQVAPLTCSFSFHSALNKKTAELAVPRLEALYESPLSSSTLWYCTLSPKPRYWGRFFTTVLLWKTYMKGFRSMVSSYV